MDNFDKLNELIKYIEQNLEYTIDNKKLAQILCVNEYTMFRIFTFIFGISVTEYIRKRRLSQAGIELQNSKIKIIDLANKYGYDSSVSFSRAFNNFHGINPSKVKQSEKYLKNFPPFEFNNTNTQNINLDFKIINQEEIKLYGVYKKCNINNIKKIAPKFWEDMKKNNDCHEVFKGICYGVIQYDELFPAPKTAKYYIASNHHFKKSIQILLPKSTWAVFKLENSLGEYMSNFSFYIYKNWIPYSGYNIRNLPELEVYNKDNIEFWLPIEKD